MPSGFTCTAGVVFLVSVVDVVSELVVGGGGGVVTTVVDAGGVGLC